MSMSTKDPPPTDDDTLLEDAPKVVTVVMSDDSTSFANTDSPTSGTTGTSATGSHAGITVTAYDDDEEEEEKKNGRTNAIATTTDTTPTTDTADDDDDDDDDTTSPSKAARTTTTTTSKVLGSSFVSSTSFVSSSTTNGGSSSSSFGGGGFFSLGETNLADRARRLKLEQQQEQAKDKTLHKEDEQEETEREDLNTTKPTDSSSSLNTGTTSTGSGTGTIADDSDYVQEFDSLLISNQIDEKDNVLYKTLVEGFKGLKVLRDDYTDDPSVQQIQQKNRRQYSATVNFIDPTTKSHNSTTPTTTETTTAAAATTNMLQQQSRLQMQGSSSINTNSIENVYEKITHIFERDYKSTLRSVQYKNIRTGETDFIGSLPVHTVITRTGLATDTKTNKGVNTPWGGTSSTAIVPVSDPAEWHTGPFCHVYIAACESLDHYQTKVKPALQAFVSQIESAASNTAANQQGGHSADYLIVYVPINGGASTSNIKDYNLSPDGNSASRRGLFQRARKRWTAAGGGGATAGGTDDDDAKSTGSIDSTTGEVTDTTDVDDPDAIAMSVALNLLSRSEQKVYKRIVADFPNGKACVLSTISLDRSDEAMANPDGVAIRTQEWNTFNRMLGAVVVNGFLDRCRRYKEELKRLDAQRAIAATAAKNSQTGSSSMGSNNIRSQQKPNPYAFNLSHFFLVKESLAFTYEQMQLPAEALLQYDEFRLYMPDLTDKEERKVRRARRKSKALRVEDNAPTLTELADAGDFLGFRKRIRTEYDLTAVLDVMRRYLFAREASLLFRMEEPVELLNRCQAFVKAMFAVMLRGVNDLQSEEEQNRRISNAAKWVVQFSWDVKAASDQYFKVGGDSADDRSIASLGSGMESSLYGMSERSDEAVAAKISELLEMSRAMFIQLGDTELEGPNPLRSFHQSFPVDLKEKWPTWIRPDEPIPDEGIADGEDLRKKLPSRLNRTVERQCLLETSFSSAKRFEETYLDLCDATIKMCRRAKRRRMAARLQAEVAEYFVRNGDLLSAIPIFQRVLKYYRMDQWDRSHFWRLFRLAYCQRTISKPTEYLKTLVSSFSPRIVAVAPTKALCALQDDLEMVLSDPSVGNARYGKLAFIETKLFIPNSSDNRGTIGEGHERKDLLKRFASVGENVEIELTIKSFLPRSIELDSVKLFVVSFDDFMKVLEMNSSIEEDHAFRIMALNAPVSLNPGINTYTIEWSPSGTGQYILSTVELIWKQGYFYYDSLDLPDPLYGIDVLPSEPTHTITVNPQSLVSGHDQEIAITIDAGTDIVSSAKLLLSCTNNLSILDASRPSETTDWRNEYDIELPPMKPGERHTLTVNVRCGFFEEHSKTASTLNDSMEVSSAVSAKLLSTYLNSRASQEEAKEMSLMKTVLESFIPVLEHSALSIDSIDVHWLEPNRQFLLNVVLTSNTPYRYCLENWKIELPHAIKVVDEWPLNGNSEERFILEGNQVCFVFNCKLDDDPTAHNNSNPPQIPRIHLDLRDDADKSLSLDLRLELPEIILLSTNELSIRPQSMKCLSSVLELTSMAGKVGEPIVMKYSFHLGDVVSSFGNGVKIAYSILGDGTRWLVGGRVKGVLDHDATGRGSCQVLGTPLVSGVYHHFPKVGLILLAPSGEKTPLSLEMRSPERFEVVSRIDDIAVAAPFSSKVY